LKYRIEEFNKDHLSKLKVGEKTKELIDFIGVEAFKNSLQANGPAFSAFADDELFIIGGINILWPGVGEAWAMLGTSYKKHGLFIHRNTVKYLANIVDTLKLRRVQAVVLASHWAGMEWVDRLGFEYEGEMKAYFQGETYLRYSKIFGG